MSFFLSSSNHPWIIFLQPCDEIKLKLELFKDKLKKKEGKSWIFSLVCNSQRRRKHFENLECEAGKFFMHYKLVIGEKSPFFKFNTFINNGKLNFYCTKYESLSTAFKLNPDYNTVLNHVAKVQDFLVNQSN